jgi:hypothetical protein
MKSTSLPRFREKHGAFYYVIKHEWQHLGRDREKALKQYRSLEGERAEVLHIVTAGNYRLLYRRTQLNAAKRGIAFILQPHEFDQVVGRARGRCEITGIKFETGAIAGAYRRPFLPSLDRMNAGGAYEISNVRLVCCAMNAALSDWGLDVFEKLATAYYWRNRRRLLLAKKGDTSAGNRKSDNASR